MYEAEERESYISTDDTMDSWVIFTRQKRMIALMKKRGYEPMDLEMEDGKVIGAKFIIPINRISILNANYKGRQMTEEQKLEAAERLRAGKEKKQG